MTITPKARYTAEDFRRIRSNGYNMPLTDEDIIAIGRALLIAERVMTEGVIADVLANETGSMASQALVRSRERAIRSALIGEDR